jgi:hypothetical protein
MPAGAAPFLFAPASGNLGPASAAPIGTVATSKILLSPGNVQKQEFHPPPVGKMHSAPPPGFSARHRIGDSTRRENGGNPPIGYDFAVGVWPGRENSNG